MGVAEEAALKSNYIKGALSVAEVSIRDRAIQLSKRVLPPKVRRGVVRLQRTLHLQWPPVGLTRFGSFRRLTPISPIFAIDRGFPIERYYIDRFLKAHSKDIRGRVLEMGDPTYINKFGGDRVTQADVLSVVDSPESTIIADLTCADHIPTDAFDCIILTQTLQMIYDMNAALQHIHRILKPGGVLLLTSHGISKIGRHLGRDDWGEYWHLTTQSLKRLMADNFPGGEILVGSFGNVLTAMCALHGLAAGEITPRELNHVDPDFEVIVTARVVKAPVTT